ncbi:MAG: hypothetical protein PPP56_05120 [Longimonas sp.]|uniref:hypothetical protein n=1 Tax=Longimonas sp. TaxID=2039626 RepID=UPI00334990AB
MTTLFRTPLQHIWIGLLAVALGSLSSTPVAAQSAADIIDQMDAAHQAMAQNVTSFTVETQYDTNRYEREEVDGRFVFREVGAGDGASADEMPMVGFLDASYIQALKEAAEYEGVESVNGDQAHVLHIADTEALSAFADLDAQDFEALESMRIFVRSSDLMPARFVFVARMPEEEMRGAPFQLDGPVTFQVDFSDYRTVDGLAYPFITEMKNDLMDQMPPEQRQQMEQAREQFRQQMEQMPPEQRRMMEEQMGDQLAQMEAMMDGDTGMRVEVKSLTVNE